jgi:parvulin-like peptidyl-prolyl isomerase
LRLDAVTDEGRAISQIFFPVKVEASDVERARQQAEDVQRRLLSGEPFAKVAVEQSADPRTAAQGGHLGSFRQDDLSPKFQEALQGVAAGQITPPFATPAGFTILQVKERIAGRAYSYEEVRETLRRALEGEKLEAELTKYVDGLRQRFFVDLKG